MLTHPLQYSADLKCSPRVWRKDIIKQLHRLSAHRHGRLAVFLELARLVGLDWTAPSAVVPPITVPGSV